MLRMAGSRFWIYDYNSDGNGRDGGASNMEDELT
jgi:hypothetical protein